MYSLATGIYQSYFAPPKLSILIIGLDGSGKTSLLERIKVTDISSRLDVDDGAVPPSLKAAYAKGAVATAARVGRNNDAVEIDNGERHQREQHRRRPQSGGRHDDGGKPARLPPPLPPKRALKSRLAVEKMNEDGFSSGAATEAGGEGAGDVLLRGVPPPPLVAADDDVVSTNDDQSEGGDARKSSAESKPSEAKPPLPSRHDAMRNAPAHSPAPETPTKKSSFIELLRCPSSAKYSNSALGEDEDEEFVERREEEDPADAAAAAEGTSSEAWSTEYLANYYVNYQEGEEFDAKSGGGARKMFPMDRIRPTLGQNLAKLDLCGCKCSLFDLSGAEKMRPLWERYYRDTDAVVYVVNAAETSPSALRRSRCAFERMCENDALSRRVRCGLPILIFANQLDVAYKEYGASMEKANNEKNGRGISWNDDEEDDFVGGTIPLTANEVDDSVDVSNRVVDFHDLVELFGLSRSPFLGDDDGQRIGGKIPATLGNVFLFGGSAKSGEGVRAAMECLVAHAKSYHLARQARR